MRLRRRREDLLPRQGLLLGEVRRRQMRLRGRGSDVRVRQRLLRGILLQAGKMQALSEAFFENGEKNDDGHG